MAAIYCTILEGEFDAIFKPEKNWNKELSGYAQEIVYTKSLKSRPWVLIKVYSSIHKDSGISRGVGKDAIRVGVISTITNKGLIKSKRINRVPGWDKRLVERVEEIWKQLLS